MQASFGFLLLALGILGCAARASNVGNARALLTKQRQHVADRPKLAITLYYETLCPYCISFVTKELNPSMERMDRLHYTNLTLVPYGNAVIDNGNVLCQHGVSECELNAWHGCILEHNNVTISLKLIACMMRGRKNHLDKCAKRYKIDVSAVKECKNSRSVDDILKKYGKISAKVNYKGVPAIAVDNNYVEEDQEVLSVDFDRTFCDKYKEKFNITLENCQPSFRGNIPFFNYS